MRMRYVSKLRVTFLTMTIIIMPIASRQISPDLIVLLSVFYNLHVQVYHGHTFGAAAQSYNWTDVWCTYLRQASISFSRRASSVGKYDRASVLKTSCCKHRIQERSFGGGVASEPGRRAVVECPEGRNDEQFRSLSNHLAEGFRKSQVPADQHTDFAEWSVEDRMRVTR